MSDTDSYVIYMQRESRKFRVFSYFRLKFNKTNHSYCLVILKAFQNNAMQVLNMKKGTIKVLTTPS